jgi:hypothetical protein
MLTPWAPLLYMDQINKNKNDILCKGRIEHITILTQSFSLELTKSACVSRLMKVFEATILMMLQTRFQLIYQHD